MTDNWKHVEIGEASTEEKFIDMMWNTAKLMQRPMECYANKKISELGKLVKFAGEIAGGIIEWVYE